MEKETREYFSNEVEPFSQYSERRCLKKAETNTDCFKFIIFDQGGDGLTDYNPKFALHGYPGYTLSVKTSKTGGEWNAMRKTGGDKSYKRQSTEFGLCGTPTVSPTISPTDLCTRKEKSTDTFFLWHRSRRAPTQKSCSYLSQITAERRRRICGTYGQFKDVGDLKSAKEVCTFSCGVCVGFGDFDTSSAIDDNYDYDDEVDDIDYYDPTDEPTDDDEFGTLSSDCGSNDGDVIVRIQISKLSSIFYMIVYLRSQLFIIIFLQFLTNFLITSLLPNKSYRH